MKASQRSLHQGSTVVIVLLFMLLLLIGLTGTTVLLTKTIKNTSYITDTIQASYGAESATELALYHLRLRKEGYSLDTQEIDITSTDKTKGIYRIEYTSIPSTIPGMPAYQTPAPGDLTPHITLDNTQGLSQTLALFRDDPNNPQSISTSPSLVTLHSTTPLPPLEIKLTGRPKTATTYQQHTMSGTTTGGNTSLELSTAPITWTVRSDVEEGLLTYGYLNTQNPTFQSFLMDHEEIYLTIRSLDRTTPVKLTLHTDIPIASYYKTISALGSYRDVIVKKVTQIQQQQLPELFSVVFTN